MKFIITIQNQIMEDEQIMFVPPSLNISKQEYHKMEKELFQIFQELILTEKSYIQNLKKCFEDFYQPIQKFLNKKNFIEIFLNCKRI